MKKKNIIKESREFTQILNNKTSKKNYYYSLFYIPKKLSNNRYGISVPKKTGTAVIRNKLKRQIKSIIDNNEISIQNSYDYVIIIKKSILDLTYQQKEQELISLFKKIGEYNEKNN